MKRPAAMSWSGGKDSSLALHAAQRGRDLDIVALLTTVTAEHDRISMHGVRTSLLRAQAARLELPLTEVVIPPACSNTVYEAAFADALRRLRAEGVEDVVFGDLFLQDIRAYREAQLTTHGMRAHFPIWQQDTRTTAREFIGAGFRAVIVCVDPAQLDTGFCGREFDTELLEQLPPACDPCGERGEFHTFVYDAPMFAAPIPIVRGTVVPRGGFVFCDVMPG